MKKTRISDRRVLFYALTWAVTYITCLIVLKEMSILKSVGILLSFLPVITFVLFLYNFIKALGEMDEVERRIQLEAAVWGFTLTITLMMTLSLLDFVVTLKKEDWSYRHLIPYFFTFYFLGIIISKRKYS